MGSSHGKGGANAEGVRTIRYPSGNVYTGTLKRNKRDGKGKYQWIDGSVYEGDWKQNKMQGSGSLKFPNGNSYDGEFHDNNPCGDGILRTSNGEVIAGTFKSLGRSPNSHPEAPVVLYQLEVNITNVETKKSQRYNGEGTLHLNTGLVVLPQMPNPNVPVLPYAVAIVAESGRNIFTDAYESVEQVPAPATTAESTNTTPLLENQAPPVAIGSPVQAQPHAQAVQVTATPAPSSVAYGVHDPALEPMPPNYRSGTAEVFDPRSYF